MSQLTIRHFCTRKEEHRTYNESSVFIQETGHEMNWEETKIFDSKVYAIFGFS